MSSEKWKIDPRLDLVLKRDIDVPVELVWEAWTQPEHLKQWFAPSPWSIASCEVDLRPGGKFSFTLCSPEGEEFPNGGCVLEVVPNERLVWTDALQSGYRPSAEPFFTAVIMMEPHGAGTRYTAVAIHRDPEGRQQHEDMGFFSGWGQVADQLAAYAKQLRAVEAK